MKLNEIKKEKIDSCGLIAYCDYIAFIIHQGLKTNDFEGLLSKIGNINLDLTELGSLRSTTKFIKLEDLQGKKYLITIAEEI